MRKVLFLMILLISTSGLAQKIHLGPEFGMNLIEVERTDLGRDYQLGYYAGGVFEYDFRNWFGIRTGLNYSQRRQASQSFDTVAFQLEAFLGPLAGLLDGFDLNTYTETNTRISQHYLEIPVMANFKFGNFNSYLGAYAGYSFAVRKRELEESVTPFVSVVDISTIDPTGTISAFLPPPSTTDFSESSSKLGLSSFDWGFKAGIGYRFDDLSLNLAYQFGMVDYRSSTPTGESIQRHQFFQSSLVYFFNLGKSSEASRI
ncbi:MAG: PorT family protein [Crocinitomicaceae bacterium]|nr:PorT family protein [Crocinitomicaceae bacterium]